MNIIVAADKNWAIGKDNKLLVSIPADMKFFRETTTGKVVVMGRKTLESFPNQRPLKNRVNIVLTKDETYQVKDALVVHDMEQLREELAKYYARADLFLFPSLYDASSIVQIESATQKTPGVFLKGSATSATVTDNVNGFISENTIGAYSDKIIEVMNNDKLLNKVKENAFIDLYVTWDKKVDEVYRIYLEKIKENKHKIL